MLAARIKYLILCSQTLAVRFWMALAAIGYASVTLFVPSVGPDEFHLMFKLASPEAWALLFLIHGIALLYGVLSRRYSTYQLILEPMLGLVLWGVSAVSHFMPQGAIGPVMVAATIHFWLLIRYPTHREFRDAV